MVSVPTNLKVNRKPTTFWCNDCQDWTHVIDEFDGSFDCARCAEPYVCGECGYDIARDGECQRPEGCPADTVPQAITDYRLRTYRSYPEELAVQPVIVQAFKPGTGWGNVIARPATSGNIGILRSRGYTSVGVRFDSRLADFTVSELLGG